MHFADLKRGSALIALLNDAGSELQGLEILGTDLDGDTFLD